MMHTFGPKPNDRVGAILSASQTEVKFLGWGTYLGDKPAPAGSPIEGRNNPCIQLDNGDMVWGFQCWWGPEKQVQQTLDDAAAQNVPVKEVRLSDVEE